MKLIRTATIPGEPHPLSVIRPVLLLVGFLSWLPFTSRAETPFDREIVDTAGSIGSSSVAIDAGGGLHVAYYDGGTDDLRYAFHDASGWILETVDTTGDVGAGASIALDSDGVPHIAYRDATQNSIKYAVREDGGWSIELLETGSDPSLEVDAQGRGHVAFQSGAALRYGIHDGGSWSSELVDASGTSPSLALDSNDDPHIAYENGFPLAYAFRNAGVWGIEDVASDKHSPSLALDSRDRARIACIDSNNGDLLYATKATGDWLIETVLLGTVFHTSLALDGSGNPHVSYGAESLTFDPFLAYAVKLDNVWRSEAVDIVGSVGTLSSLALDGAGRPVLSYQANGDLHVADSRLTVLSPSGGEAWTVGARAYVHWDGAGPVDVLLSGDGGLNYETLVSGVSSHAVPVTVPLLPTEVARIRIASGDPRFFADGDAFRILPRHDPPDAGFLRTFAPVGANGERLGAPLAAVDLDGDGVRDIAAAAIQADGFTGRVCVYLSTSGFDETPDLVLTGEAAGDAFGYGMADAGDVNNDGFGDLVVGAPLNDAGGPEAGRAYLYLGGPAPDDVADVTMTGEAAGDFFGYAGGAAGDVNGDGFSDLLVGAPYNAAGGTDAGRVYLYHGRSFPDASAEQVLTGTAGDELGTYVSGGDMNGDGFADIAAGAASNAAGGPGRAYVYFGGPDADSAPDLIVEGETDSDRFGQSVALNGDVNGDGFSDLLVGANQSGFDTGKAYVFHGGAWPDGIPELVLHGEGNSDGFGLVVSFAGDLNDDGFDDVATGASHNDAGGSDAGRAYVYFGGPGMDAVADVVFTGEEGDELGIWTSPAGDLNRDGVDDLLTGSVGYASSDGRVELYNFNRYHLLSAQGGGTWNVGATEFVSWLGAEPADIWLSVDGGATYGVLRREAGGETSNTLALLVPHQPTRFARVRLTPSDPAVTGLAESDSIFTIDATIGLMVLRAEPAPAGETGVLVSWQTDPGPEDLSGYRVEKTGNRPAGWQTVVPLTRETSLHDRDGTPGTRYRLTAINGLGEELVLGETSAAPLRLLAAGPMPFRGGDLTVTFAATGGAGGGPGRAEVGLFDVSGRLVRWIARGNYPQGFHEATWDARDEAGHPVAAGTYFLRAATGGGVSTVKVTVVR